MQGAVVHATALHDDDQPNGEKLMTTIDQPNGEKVSLQCVIPAKMQVFRRDLVETD